MGFLELAHLPARLNMNHAAQQLANLIFALEKTAIGVSGYLRDAQQSVDVVDFSDASEVERYVMACNIEKCIEQALSQQRLCDQIRAKALEVLHSAEHLQ